MVELGVYDFFGHRDYEMIRRALEDAIEADIREAKEREMDERELTPEQPEDEGYTCNDCGRKPNRGWKGKMPVALDGNNWPLDFAAKMLGCSEKDLRDLVRITGLEPIGTMKMASYRRSGRHPRAYDGSKLVLMWQAVNDLAENLHED
jgi:hypothetical protein